MKRLMRAFSFFLKNMHYDKNMNANEMIGCLIRKERMRRNWSLAGLAKGICAVSYLSKIEQGKADCSKDILNLLFAKLSIIWHSETSFVHRAEHFANQVYESIFAMEEISFSDEEMQLLEEMEHSAYVIDALVCVAWKKGCVGDSLTELKAYMNERQLCLVYLLEEKYAESLRIYPCALTYYYAGMHGYVIGKSYERATQMLEKAYQLASVEGFVMIMLQSELLMGNLSGNLLDVNAMLHHYAIAQRLAKALDRKEDLRTMGYNKAAVLIEAGRPEEAYQYFKTLENLSVMERHKYAIAAELTGRKEEALAVLNDNHEEMDDLTAKMVEVVRIRLTNSDYLEDDGYGKMLMEVFARCEKDYPIGYAAFHVPWVLQWYVHHRQYRSAFELSNNFPIKIHYEMLNEQKAG